MKVYGLKEKKSGDLVGVDVYSLDGATRSTTFSLERARYATVFLWTTDSEEDALRVANESTDEFSFNNSYMNPTNVFKGNLEVVELFDTQD